MNHTTKVFQLGILIGIAALGLFSFGVQDAAATHLYIYDDQGNFIDYVDHKPWGPTSIDYSGEFVNYNPADYPQTVQFSQTIYEALPYDVFVDFAGRVVYLVNQDADKINSTAMEIDCVSERVRYDESSPYKKIDSELTEKDVALATLNDCVDSNKNKSKYTALGVSFATAKQQVLNKYPTMFNQYFE